MINYATGFYPTKRFGKPILPMEQEKLLKLSPTEFGENIARHHLEMIKAAVEEWATEQGVANKPVATKSAKSSKKKSDKKSK